MASPAKGSITTVAATAIGVGGMMGAGLFTLLGAGATSAGTALPLAFVVGAFVAVFSVYSYARLGAAFPSRGGAAEFLISSFGDGVLAGGLNVFQYVGWVIAMALYAAGFAEYARDLAPTVFPEWSERLIAIGLIALVVVVNAVGAALVGRAESGIVVLELVILAAFGVVGLTKADVAQLGDGGGSGPLGVVFAAGLLYVTFEGFGVVTNSAGSMRAPAKQLPRAMFTALGIVLVIYVVVSVVVVTTMSLASIEAASGHVLAEAGEVVFGRVGGVVIGVAALLATASAVNATMFGDANLAFQVARDGEAPATLERTVGAGATTGLLLTAGLTAAFVVVFPLEAVGAMASLAFLLVYASVSVGHLRIRSQTGARRAPLVAAVALNATLFCLLVGYTVREGQAASSATLVGVLALSFVVESVYRRRTGRSLRVQRS